MTKLQITEIRAMQLEAVSPMYAALKKEAENPGTLASRLSFIYSQVHQFTPPFRSELLRALAVNPNIDDELAKLLLREFPTEFLNNPVVVLRLLEDPGWLRKLISVNTALVLLHKHPEHAHTFLGIPMVSMSFKTLHEYGGVPGANVSRTLPPIRRLDGWRVADAHSAPDWLYLVNWDDGSHQVVTHPQDPRLSKKLGVHHWSLFLRSSYQKNPIGMLQRLADEE